MFTIALTGFILFRTLQALGERMNEPVIDSEEY